MMSPTQTSAIDNSNESDSELSDPPSDLDDHQLDLDLDAGIHRLTINSPGSPTKSSRMGNAQSTMNAARFNNDGDVAVANPGDNATTEAKARARARAMDSPGYEHFRLMNADHSKLESLPNEVSSCFVVVSHRSRGRSDRSVQILNQIALYVDNDRDFMNLASSSPLLAQSLIPADSPIWKKRFLSLYDVPLVDEHAQYSVAYQMRRFVLSNFVAFDDPKDARLKVQLSNLRDMVIGKPL